jgi:hypothetical protein
MVSDLFFYELVLCGLLLLCILLHDVGPSDRPGGEQRPSKPLPPPRQRSGDLLLLPGLTCQPHCAACEQAAQAPAAPPPPAPPPIPSSRGRPRQGETSPHCCPNPAWAYRGWVPLGHLRANGPPGGGPWRQWHCTVCDRSVLETHGAPFHGKHVSPDLLVWAVGA